MPRVASNQIITHRIELGKWERDNIGKPVAETAQVARVISSAGIAAAGIGVVAAVYALWQFWGVAIEELDKATPYTSRALVGPARTFSQFYRIFRGL